MRRAPLWDRPGGSGANARVAGDDEEMQRFVPIEDLFKGRHFDRQLIVLCVSWYTSFKLSLRDLVIMMADRGISVTHTTILRWVKLCCEHVFNKVKAIAFFLSKPI